MKLWLLTQKSLEVGCQGYELSLLTIRRRPLEHFENSGVKTKPVFAWGQYRIERLWKFIEVCVCHRHFALCSSERPLLILEHYAPLILNGDPVPVSSQSGTIYSVDPIHFQLDAEGAEVEEKRRGNHQVI